MLLAVSEGDFSEFLPKAGADQPTPDGTKAFEELRPSLGKAKVKEEKYTPLVEYLKTLCPKLGFRDKNSKIMQIFEGQEIRVDINVCTNQRDDKKHEATFKIKLKNSSYPFGDNVTGFVNILTKDLTGNRSPVGRSTRYFKAYRLERNGLVLIKDSWRSIVKYLKAEHKIYAKLRAAKVSHIPETYYGRDVGEDKSPHVTQTSSWCIQVKPPLEILLRTFHRCRLALEYVDLKLDQFDNVTELVTVIRDASIAHGEAATNAKILHRHINNGNIMFSRRNGKVKGYLIDWDLSLDLTIGDSGMAQLERTGTWQFLAIRLLEERTDEELVIQDRIDDIESFFHLLAWMALRYTAHKLCSEQLTSILYNTFDASWRTKDGKSYITYSRSLSLVSNGLVNCASFRNQAIELVLSRMQFVLRHRYINPKTSFEHLKPAKSKQAIGIAETERKRALAPLDDPKWLPNLLTEALEDREINWDGDANRVVHVLYQPPKSAIKRKVESTEVSNKPARLGGQATPHDQPSGGDA